MKNSDRREGKGGNWEQKHKKGLRAVKNEVGRAEQVVCNRRIPINRVGGRFGILCKTNNKKVVGNFIRMNRALSRWYVTKEVEDAAVGRPNQNWDRVDEI